MEKFPTLFARTNTGAIQQWDIVVDGSKYQTIFGQVNGILQTTKWTECYATNVGKSNERNPEEQSIFEAKALWKKKKDSGYFESINDIDNVKFTEPMLAKNFDDYKTNINYPVFSNPKLDGIRLLVSKDGMFSRNGKPILSCPHIKEELEYLFEKYPDVTLDGELYCDKLNNDFNKICSLVKKTKPTQKDLEESKNTIQYHIYDVILNGSFSKRLEFLNLNVKESNNIRLVEAKLCYSLTELDSLYEHYMSLGFEGQMVRLDSVYENKRSKNLLKRKEFQDDEYVILAVLEGEGNKSGMAGSMLFQNEKGLLFNSNIKGNREYLKELWENKQSYKGKLATVKYFNLTPDNKLPRFPYVIGIRDYE